MNAFVDALTPGTKVGECVLDQAIGQGASGIVYRAKHPRLGTVAVKEYFPKQIASRQKAGTLRPSTHEWQESWDKGIADLKEEAEALRRLRHASIVKVHEHIEEHGTIYIVMELVDGRPISKILDEGRRLRPEEIERIAADLVDALRHLHRRGVIHRDIAPDNVLLLANGEPVLIDFGSARLQVAHLTQTLNAAVKSGYSPIENYSAGATSSLTTVGPWTDIYSTAALLYRLVSNDAPADAVNRMHEAVAKRESDAVTPLATRARTFKGFRPEFLAAIDAGMALKPGDRPQSAEDWLRLFDLPRRPLLPSWAPWAIGAITGAGALAAALALLAPAQGLIVGPTVFANEDSYTTATTKSGAWERIVLLDNNERQEWQVGFYADSGPFHLPGGATAGPVGFALECEPSIGLEARTELRNEYSAWESTTNRERGLVWTTPSGEARFADELLVNDPSSGYFYFSFIGADFGLTEDQFDPGWSRDPIPELIQLMKRSEGVLRLDAADGSWAEFPLAGFHKLYEPYKDFCEPPYPLARFAEEQRRTEDALRAISPPGVVIPVVPPDSELRFPVSPPPDLIEPPR